LEGFGIKGDVLLLISVGNVWMSWRNIGIKQRRGRRGRRVLRHGGAGPGFADTTVYGRNT